MKKAIIFISLLGLLIFTGCHKPKSPSGKQYPGQMTPQNPCPGGCP